jgi:hypothetical protein
MARRRVMGKLIGAILLKGLPTQDIKNANIVNLWVTLWAGSLLVAVLAQEIFSFNNLISTLIMATLNIICGLMMIQAYRHMLRTLDEMERKIQLDALALSVGVAMLTFSASGILQTADILPQLEASWLLTIMAFSYSIGLVLGRLRLA